MFYNKLKIQNFGPIKNGYDQDDGFLTFNQLCVFCGTQGTGKSIVVKLYATFVWLEKALMRGDIKPKDIEQYNRFVNKYLAYQGIESYIKDNTFIHFKGECFDFIYKKAKFQVKDHRDELQYTRPQIMYVPAERNLLSALEKSTSIKGLPDTLAALQEVYRQACQFDSEGISLPVNDVEFKYDTLNNIARIEASDYKVRLSKASSGIQSVTPLFITLHYLNQCVTNHEKSNSDQISEEDKKRIDARINKLLLDETLDDNTRTALIKKLSDNINKRLINIIEEPEQNLFPDSQERVLHQMIQLSAQAENQLLLTTHSPYILNYLMLSIKASQVEKVSLKSEHKKELNAIVPQGARIKGTSVTVFQLELDGNIHKLETIDDIPSDSNHLNTSIMDTNIKYAKLLEIQGNYE